MVLRRCSSDEINISTSKETSGPPEGPPQRGWASPNQGKSGSVPLEQKWRGGGILDEHPRLRMTQMRSEAAPEASLRGALTFHQGPPSEGGWQGSRRHRELQKAGWLPPKGPCQGSVSQTRQREPCGWGQPLWPAPACLACRLTSSLWPSWQLGAAPGLAGGTGGQWAVVPASAICRPWRGGETLVCGGGRLQQSRSPHGWVPGADVLAPAAGQTRFRTRVGTPPSSSSARALWDCTSPAWGPVSPHALVTQFCS